MEEEKWEREGEAIRRIENGDKEVRGRKKGEQRGEVGEREVQMCESILTFLLNNKSLTN